MNKIPHMKTLNYVFKYAIKFHEIEYSNVIAESGLLIYCFQVFKCYYSSIHIVNDDFFFILVENHSKNSRSNYNEIKFE